jgi:TonB family protein
MNAAARFSLGPRVRSLALILGVLGAQAGVILFLSDRSAWVAPEPAPTSVLRLAEVTHRTLIPDPTLLALPSAAGFAGVAWRQAHEPKYVSQPWDERPRWLTAREAPLGRSFLEAHRPEIGRGLTAEKPVPELAHRAVSPVRLPERSLVRVEGDLARLEWLTPLSVPSIAHSNILTETVVQLTVHPAGQVLSAIVLKSSGLRSADQQALALARDARFAPRREPAGTGNGEGGEWTWGRLIIHWRTVVPPEKEAAPPRAS